MEIFERTRLYSALPRFDEARTWAEIDLGALRFNYKYLSETLRERALSACGKAPEPICVVKADAYGHGACGAVPVFLSEGCRFFAVSSIEEAVEVRNICRNRGVDARVLILGLTLPSLVRKLAEYDIITTLPSLEYAERLSAAAATARVRVRCHIKLDTGMNRLGFAACSEDDFDRSAEEIKSCSKLKGISLEGIFTHFAEADDSDSEELSGKTLLQAKRFFGVIKALEKRRVRIAFKHVCNSAAAIRFPEIALDGVRLGIALYGARPSESFELPLRPAMSFKTKISHIHTLREGETVSYGGRFEAERDTRIATLPVGYADGFLRAYGGASVKISSRDGDTEAPIIGRICMDQCMISLDGSDPARVGDEVTLFGDTPERLYSLAKTAGTIPYEILCAVSARVVRIYKEDGNVL